MKYFSLYLMTLSIVMLTIFGCKKNDINENRFSYYEVISTQTEVIKVKFIEWATTDRPGFITEENYNAKKNDTTLVNYCFYLDTKNNDIQNFSAKNIEKLNDGETIELTGRYYKTKKFDDIFPYKESNTYSFKPKDGYFTVFVYESIK